MTFAEATRLLINDPIYKKNVKYGVPRSGHPEGTIEAHIAALLANVHRLHDYITDDFRDKLIFLCHIHDLFKGDAKKNVPIIDPNSHATLAKEFAKKFTMDAGILQIIQYHDFNYGFWKRYKTEGMYNPYDLTKHLQMFSPEDMPLYLLFTLVDGCVHGKQWEKPFWFIDQAMLVIPTLDFTFSKAWMNVMLRTGEIEPVGFEEALRFDEKVIHDTFIETMRRENPVYGITAEEVQKVALAAFKAGENKGRQENEVKGYVGISFDDWFHVAYPLWYKEKS